jgi:hypothetical protein
MTHDRGPCAALRSLFDCRAVSVTARCPRQLSGGQNRRVFAVSIALTCDADLPDSLVPFVRKIFVRHVSFTRPCCFKHAPSLRNANAGARHDSAEVDLLAKLEDMRRALLTSGEISRVAEGARLDSEAGECHYQSEGP